jgi:hypothetical protein
MLCSSQVSAARGARTVAAAAATWSYDGATTTTEIVVDATTYRPVAITVEGDTLDAERRLSGVVGMLRRANLAKRNLVRVGTRAATNPCSAMPRRLDAGVGFGSAAVTGEQRSVQRCKGAPRRAAALARSSPCGALCQFDISLSSLISLAADYSPSLPPFIQDETRQTPGSDPYAAGQTARLLKLASHGDRLAQVCNPLCPSTAAIRPPHVHRLAVSMEGIPEVHGRRCWVLTCRVNVANRFDVMKAISTL